MIYFLRNVTLIIMCPINLWTKKLPITTYKMIFFLEENNQSIKDRKKYVKKQN